ncbi:UDP-N-acetyl-D-mannosamine dehydrogenase [Sphingorhabdus arenilitoris]|uniref:UDP-N-acetyl-D-mannosamine dehydrogenase n=1 Tax=Sphingorhabdus arenilitoris TaxID=1490041 RepID=A0ABV8RGV5_9SPHN
MPPKKMPHVTMVGLGYIGLPTAAVMARAGFTVLGLDVKQHVVDTINEGRIHIEEHDLDILVHDMVACGRLSAAIHPQSSDIFVIAVPTPVRENNAPDISCVLQAAKWIAPVLQKGNVIILESTSPIGTTANIGQVLAEMRPDLNIAGQSESPCDIHLAYCPERVLPGQIIAELVSNDRSIGGMTPHCAAKAREFYETFVEGECVETTAATAEMVKLVENASRDVSIAFANELSLIADHVGTDVWEVISLANRHPRVNILQPGPGVGGHCIAVDPWFLVHSAPEQTPLIATARGVNDGKPGYVIAQAEKLITANPDAKIACLGLSFKANIDDFRESPALHIAAELAKKYGERVQIVEPYCTSLPPQFDRSGAVHMELESALNQCDIIIVLVDHNRFKKVDPSQFDGKMLLDTRGLYRRT